MRKWREDRLLRQDEVAGLLDIELGTYQAWEDGVGLPPDLAELGMRFRALQIAAGEKMRDIVLVDAEGQSTGETRFGITIEDVQDVWGRFMSDAQSSARPSRPRQHRATQA